MRRMMYTLIGAVLVSLGSSAAAQRYGEMTLYSERNFRGATYTVTGPRAFIRIPWQVRSVRVQPGQNWELCRDVEYRGCIWVEQSMSNLRTTVGSARPGGGPLPAPPIGGPVGQSLRGMSSEYFVAPTWGAGRIEVRPSTAAEAGRRADEFCRSRGWRGAAFQQLQTVGRRVYLTDVLCVRSGR